MLQFHRFFFYSTFISFLLIFSSSSYSQIHYYTNLVMNGSKEVPSNGSAGTALLNAWYDEGSMMLGFTANFQGLTGTTTAAHFHGPAAPDSNAGVQIGWTGFPTGVTSGSFSDTVTLNATQEAQLLAGRWYANIHSSSFPGGEIRSQLFETNAVHSFSNLIMNGSKEVPSNGSTGSAILTVTYNESTNQLDMTVNFSGLSANTTAAHFHGPAPVDSNAGVQVGWTGFPTGVTSGSYSNTFSISETQEDQLLAGRWYANIHTTAFPGGEIRSQLFENPTIDGNLSNPQYIPVANKLNFNSGFGPNINVNHIYYYPDNNSSTLYLAFEGKLNTGSGDGIGFWLGFDQLTGSSAGTALGGSPGGHYMSGNGGANPNFKSDFEVDYMFAVNPGGGATDVFFDAVKLVGARTAQYLGQASQTGTPAGNINSNFFSTNSVWFAFNNDGAFSHGFEVSIPFSELGVTSAGEITTFAFVVSGTAFFSDVTVPGNVTGGNPGFDADFSILAGGPYNSGADPLPVELSSFSASLSGSSVTLNWITSTEINNHGFEIQRRVGNNDWATIGFKEGNGTTSQQNEYSYSDDISHLSVLEVSYRLKQIDFNGTFEFSNIIEVFVGTPNGFMLTQNYPNPFNPTTSIRFAFDKNSKAQLKVYDVLGNEVANLFNENVEPGRVYKINFDASNLSSGVYYYQLSGDNKTEIKKMMLLK